MCFIIAVAYFDGSAPATFSEAYPPFLRRDEFSVEVQTNYTSEALMLV